MKGIVLSMFVVVALLTTSCCSCGVIDKAQSLIEKGKELATIEIPDTSGTEPTPADPGAATATPAAPEGDSDAQPTPAPDQQETAEMVRIQDLDSYRVEWKVTTQLPGQEESVASYIGEWVREPPARHLTIMLGDVPAGEFIVVGDQMWISAGDQWISSQEDATAAIFDGLAEAAMPDAAMTLVGQETMNGIQCKHYVYEFDAGEHQVRREAWVADQADLPQAPIRMLYRVESQAGEGTVVSLTEADFYDINQPIDIQPPQ